jgi:hypothetical protein
MYAARTGPASLSIICRLPFSVKFEPTPAVRFGLGSGFYLANLGNLTEFWKSFMLTPRLKEVSVGKQTKCLATAVSVTVLDAAAVTYYGGVVWKAFAVVIWSKLLLLLLVAVWATTLLHIWVHACSRLRQENQEHRVVVSMPVNGLSAELAEEIDV